MVDVGNLSGFDYLSVVLFWEKAAFMWKMATV